MPGKNRLAAALLALLFLTVILLSAAFVATRTVHHHCCSGGECWICAALSRCESFLRGLGLPGLAAAVILTAGLMGFFSAERRSFFCERATPVMLRVKLTD